MVVESLNPLAAVSPHALQSGYLARLYLFDSDGRRWRIASFETTPAYPRGAFGKLVGVQLSLSAAEQPTLSDIVEDLCRLVDFDRDDLYNQFVTHDELKSIFRAVVTPSDLLAAASSLGES